MSSSDGPVKEPGKAITARRLALASTIVFSIVTFFVGIYLSKTPSPTPTWTPFAQTVVPVSSLLLSFSGLMYVNMVNAIKEIKRDLAAAVDFLEHRGVSSDREDVQALILHATERIRNDIEPSMSKLTRISDGQGRILFEMFGFWVAGTASALIIILAPILNMSAYDGLFFMMVYGAGMVATNFVLLLSSARAVFDILQRSISTEAELIPVPTSPDTRAN